MHAETLSLAVYLEHIQSVKTLFLQIIYWERQGCMEKKSQK